MASRSDPVVCTLTSSQAGDRLTEWSDLQHVATSIETLPDGVRFHLPAEHADEAQELVDRESQCCLFLEIEIADQGESIEMTITSPNPDGVPVVHLFAGLANQ
jgi:hypothetical protein